MKCLNIHEVGWTAWGKYIGRQKNFPLHFGNPFIIGVDGTRDEVCDKHMMWMMGVSYHWVEPKRREWIWKHLHELEGKDLLCFCAPEHCHGENYIFIIEEELTP